MLQETTYLEPTNSVIELPEVNTTIELDPVITLITVGE